jgi:S-DNA-T family DNA segregation ATPase FtsK/SpoIIIE
LFLIFPIFIIKVNKNKIAEVCNDLNSLVKEKDSIQIGLSDLKLRDEEKRDEILRSFPPLKKQIIDFFENQLKNIARNTRNEWIKMPLFLQSEWTEDILNNAEVPLLNSRNDICIGNFSEKLSERKFEIPACISIIGENKTFFLLCNNETLITVNSIMESWILKIAFMLRNQVIFTFFDPDGFGKTFPIAKDLPTRESNFDISRTMESIMEDMQRIIRRYGLSDDFQFDFNAKEILINEHFEFIFAANFPKNYNRNQIEGLKKIGNLGPIAGKYLFIQYNKEIELPDGFEIEDFKNKNIIDFIKNDKYGGTVCKLQFTPSLKPDYTLKLKLIDHLKNFKKSEKAIWEETVSLPIESWWKENSNEYIQTPMGQNPLSDKLSIWFGVKHNEGNRPCAHGILAAMTGSGKSNFYHVVILGFAMRYSPKELSFYLIDGKDGVEFQPYKSLPHAEFISLKSQPKLSRSILSELIEEKERRNELFVSIGTNDYESYRKKCRDDNSIPRILLLIDEYQELFEGDRDGTASSNLLILAQQGRSVGIHMLLGSQRFSVVGLLHQSSIFANIHLLIAMQMSLTDRQALNEFGKEGKELISKCTHPGDIVINDKSGGDGGNKIGKVALITDQSRNDVLSKLIEKSTNEFKGSELHSVNIFNGTEQPRLIDNPYFKYLINFKNWLSEIDFENYARKDAHLGGLGEYNWVSGEYPFVGWLGQEFNTRGYSRIIFTQKRQENALVIGNNNEARFGMLCSLVMSIAINYGPTKCVFYLIDKTIPGSPWNGILSKLNQEFLIPLKYSSIVASTNNQSENIIELLFNEIQTRNDNLGDSEIKKKSTFLISADIEKLNSIKQVQNKYGTFEESDLGKKYLGILDKGPESGIYSIHSFESVSSMLSVNSKKGIELFNHRIVLQMSEDDSYTVIKKREASRLQIEGKRPICSYYLDNSRNLYSLFKPYCIDKDFYNEINEIIKLLANR